MSGNITQEIAEAYRSCGVELDSNLCKHYTEEQCTSKRFAKALWEEKPSHHFAIDLADTFRDIGNVALQEVVLDYVCYTNNPGNGTEEVKKPIMNPRRKRRLEEASTIEKRRLRRYSRHYKSE